MVRAGDPNSPKPGISGTLPRTALESAQELCWDAWEFLSSKKRIELARKALKLSPDCADAYVIIANETKGLKRRVELYAKGVEAGERALGPKAFKDDVGHFWGLLCTRPYMRARVGLAESLWEMGRHDEAIVHCSEMLRLNPGDNQGVRYVLVRYLLGKDRDSDAVEIMNFYEGDGSADWNYTWLLITLRMEGDSERTRDLLRSAVRGNCHVPAFLLGKRPLPQVLPEELTFGCESEAVHYAATYSILWRKSRGALEWLERQMKWDE